MAAGRAATATASVTSTSVRRRPNSIREKIEFPFFNYYLKGKGDGKAPRGLGLRDRAQPVAQRRTPGRRRPPQPKTLYFHAEGKLSFDAPAEPTPPVRRIRQRSREARALHRLARPGMTREYMVEDQRFAATRPDVLVYQTEPLDARRHLGRSD